MIIRYHIVQTLLIWILWYSIWVFTIWELYNPFQWIIDLPTYEWTDRFMLLTFWLFYNVISLVLWRETIKRKLSE